MYMYLDVIFEELIDMYMYLDVFSHIWRADRYVPWCHIWRADRYMYVNVPWCVYSDETNFTLSDPDAENAFLFKLKESMARASQRKLLKVKLINAEKYA